MPKQAQTQPKQEAPPGAEQDDVEARFQEALRRAMSGPYKEEEKEPGKRATAKKKESGPHS